MTSFLKDQKRGTPPQQQTCGACRLKSLYLLPSIDTKDINKFPLAITSEISAAIISIFFLSSSQAPEQCAVCSLWLFNIVWLDFTLLLLFFSSLLPLSAPLHLCAVRHWVSKRDALQQQQIKTASSFHLIRAVLSQLDRGSTCSTSLRDSLYETFSSSEVLFQIVSCAVVQESLI